jgi:hypothetical protein
MAECIEQLQVALDVANGADATDDMQLWALALLEALGVCTRLPHRVREYMVKRSNSTALYCLTGHVWNTEPMRYSRSHSGRYFVGSAG